jgi:Tat protein secretion system quality control protein TatD with DNase activity
LGLVAIYMGVYHGFFKVITYETRHAVLILLEVIPIDRLLVQYLL